MKLFICQYNNGNGRPWDGGKGYEFVLSQDNDTAKSKVRNNYSLRADQWYNRAWCTNFRLIFN